MLYRIVYNGQCRTNLLTALSLINCNGTTGVEEMIRSASRPTKLPRASITRYRDSERYIPHFIEEKRKCEERNGPPSERKRLFFLLVDLICCSRLFRSADADQRMRWRGTWNRSHYLSILRSCKFHSVQATAWVQSCSYHSHPSSSFPKHEMSKTTLVRIPKHLLLPSMYKTSFICTEGLKRIKNKLVLIGQIGRMNSS